MILLLVSYWLARQAPMHIHDVGMLDLPFTIHIMKVAGGLLCVFMMWRANLPFAIHIMNVLSSLLSAFMKKVVQLYGHHECGMLNFECAQQFAIHIHDRNGKFEWVWH